MCCKNIYKGLLELQPSESNEIALLIKDDQEVDVIKKESEEMLPDAKIEDWKALSPELNLII